MSTPESFYQKLRRPFPIEELHLVPGQVVLREQKTFAMVLPYLPWTSYVNRLDEVFGWEGWSVRFRPLFSKILRCRLLVCLPGGRTVEREGLGAWEPERAEVSQKGRSLAPIFSGASRAFRRACAALQIGSYLYRMPPLWGEIDPEQRHFLDPGALARELYRKAGIPDLLDPIGAAAAQRVFTKKLKELRTKSASLSKEE